MDFTTIERAKRSTIRLERGITLSQLGETAEASTEFETALRDARAEDISWELRLHQRFLRVDDPITIALWVAVLEAFDEQRGF